jgi:hypothetical protein
MNNNKAMAMRNGNGNNENAWLVMCNEIVVIVKKNK